MEKDETKRLLIVDDESDIRLILEEDLEGVADEYYQAENGEKALEILSNHPINCVITDLSMPVMNGLELVKHINEYYPNVSCIILTGHGDKESTIQALRCGVFDFLEKPFNVSNVKEIVSAAIDLNQAKCLAEKSIEDYLSVKNLSPEQSMYIKNVKQALTVMKHFRKPNKE